MITLTSDKGIYRFGPEDLIGVGGCASLFLSRFKAFGEHQAEKKVALKVAKRKTLHTQYEGEIHRLLSGELENSPSCHPNIVKLLDVFNTEGISKTQETQEHIVTEYCKGGDLNKFITKNAVLCEAECIYILKQLLCGLYHIHNFGSPNIIHRDIKPKNLLVKDDLIKIADFGFACYTPSFSSSSPFLYGSDLFLAPEIRHSQHAVYTRASDIYALGVTLSQLAYGRSITAKLMRYACSGRLSLPVNKCVSDGMMILVKMMASVNDRATMHHIMHSSIFDMSDTLLDNTSRSSMKLSPHKHKQMIESMFRELRSSFVCKLIVVVDVYSVEVMAGHDEESGYMEFELNIPVEPYFESVMFIV